MGGPRLHLGFCLAACCLPAGAEWDKNGFAGGGGDPLALWLQRLRGYAESGLRLGRPQDGGNAWAALRLLGGRLRAGQEIALRDLGAARALAELTLLELLESSERRVLLAANQTLAELGLERWSQVLAADFELLAAALPGDRLVLAAGYLLLYWVTTSNLKPDADGLVRMESHSSLTQAWWLGRQVSAASVTRICEVGFNAGHSAMSMLLSAPGGASLLSFDLVSKSYTPACADFLRRAFPGRFQLVPGPSNQTVPRFVASNLAAPPCDVVYIDGGHEFEEARSDLLFMSLLASRGRSLVIMDDVGCEAAFCRGPTRAWRAFAEAGRLRELGCLEELQRRWCWGIYM